MEFDRKPYEGTLYRVMEDRLDRGYPVSRVVQEPNDFRTRKQAEERVGELRETYERHDKLGYSFRIVKVPSLFGHALDEHLLPDEARGTFIYYPARTDKTGGI